MVAISLAIIALSQVAYWTTVRPGDVFFFPSYPFHTGRGGADAIVAGYVGLVALAGLAVWLTVTLVFIRRGSVKAWAQAAAAAGIAVAFACALLAGAIGFAFDLHQLPSSILVLAGLFGGAAIMLFAVSPSKTERLERMSR